MTLLKTVSKARMLFSVQELLEISIAVSRDFMPQFSVSANRLRRLPAFSARELLNISQEINRQYSFQSIVQTANLVLLPVDPYHLHVYWQLPQYNLITEHQIDEGEQLTLRVFSQPVEKSIEVGQPQTLWFDTIIAGNYGHKQLYIPEFFPENNRAPQFKEHAGLIEEHNFSDDVNRVKTYTASIGVLRQNTSFHVIANSNPIEMKRQYSMMPDHSFSGFDNVATYEPISSSVYYQHKACAET